MVVLSLLLLSLLVPMIYHIPDVVITDSNGQERKNDVLETNENYTVNMRREPWDDQQFKIYHVIHKIVGKSSRWIKSQTELKPNFINKGIDNVKIEPTQASAILVIKSVGDIQVSYVSTTFSLLHRDYNKVCINWIDKEKTRYKESLPSQSCPCTLQQAKQDPNYVDDVFCTSLDVHYFWEAENFKINKGAHHCMINKISVYVVHVP